MVLSPQESLCRGGRGGGGGGGGRIQRREGRGGTGGGGGGGGGTHHSLILLADLVVAGHHLLQTITCRTTGVGRVVYKLYINWFTLMITYYSSFALV